jgi:voltage-gated potassium channel
MSPEAPSPEGKLLAWMRDKQGSRNLTAGRAALIIVLSTVTVTVAGGVVVRLVDHEDFGSLGEAMWWAVQTVTTVGYGDVVPRQTLGRLIGAVVMLNGIAFISLITAAVTATLVEQARRREAEPEEPLAAKLDRISARLEALEARFEGRGPRKDP